MSVSEMEILEPLYVDTNIEYELDMAMFPGWEDENCRLQPMLLLHMGDECSCLQPQTSMSRADVYPKWEDRSFTDLSPVGMRIDISCEDADFLENTLHDIFKDQQVPTSSPIENVTNMLDIADFDFLDRINTLSENHLTQDLLDGIDTYSNDLTDILLPLNDQEVPGQSSTACFRHDLNACQLAENFIEMFDDTLFDSVSDMDSGVVCDRNGSPYFCENSAILESYHECSSDAIYDSCELCTVTRDNDISPLSSTSKYCLDSDPESLYTYIENDSFRVIYSDWSECANNCTFSTLHQDIMESECYQFR